MMGEIYLFTASTAQYADPIIDEIDPKGFIKKRFYREHCKQDKEGVLLKPMEIITKNKKKLIIIEDSKEVYKQYNNNTILVSEWTPSVRKDQDLQNVIGVLDSLLSCRSKDVSADLKAILEI